MKALLTIFSFLASFPMLMAQDTLSVPFAVETPACLVLDPFRMEQSEELREAFDTYAEKNRDRKIKGYRVRIYFDSSRDARTVSQQIEEEFRELYPDVPVYRSYTSPFFKVTVGDFRTRDDAQMFARSISGRYTSTFLVKESINYPALWSNRD